MTCRKHEYTIEEGTFFNTLFVPRELGLAMLGLELASSDHAACTCPGLHASQEFYLRG